MMTFRHHLACVLAGLLALGNPASAQQSGAVQSLYEMRTEKVVMQQWDLSCGAAALATLLRFQHGDGVSEREIALTLMAQPRYVNNPLLVQLRNGFSLLDLKQFADDRGYQGIGFGGLDLDGLIARAPAMVPIDRAGYNHFVVFRGRMGDRVLLADPSFGTFSMSVRQFDDAWLDLPDLGRVGFVVARRDGTLLPPGRLAPRREEFVTLR